VLHESHRHSRSGGDVTQADGVQAVPRRQPAHRVSALFSSLAVMGVSCHRTSGLPMHPHRTEQELSYHASVL
jgi:hypothetical protein